MRVKWAEFDVLETAEVFEFEALDEEAVVFQVAPSFHGLGAETNPGGSAARDANSHYHLAALARSALSSASP